MDNYRFKKKKRKQQLNKHGIPLESDRPERRRYFPGERVSNPRIHSKK